MVVREDEEEDDDDDDEDEDQDEEEHGGNSLVYRPCFWIYFLFACLYVIVVMFHLIAYKRKGSNRTVLTLWS